MLLFHLSEHQTEHREDSGQFTCPECQADTTYDLYRTYRHTYLMILIPIPIHSKHLFGERLRCTSCGASLPITALAIDAPVVSSATGVGREAESGISNNLGNVIELSETAAQEILRRYFSGNFQGKPVVRITPPFSPNESYMIGFDYALADGRDWIGESRGIGIVVDHRDTALMLGRTIDFRDGVFCERTATTKSA